MELTSRRSIEQLIIIAVAESLIAAGCTVCVAIGEEVFIADSTDPTAIDAALYKSGEADFQVKRVIDGILQEGWVDFLGANGIEVTASENLQLHDALLAANALAAELLRQSES